MHVLHVWRDGGDGGAPRAIREIARLSQAAGYSTTVAAGPGSFDYGVEKIEIPAWGRSAREVPRLAVLLRRAVRAVQPDLVHCHSVGLGVPMGLTGRAKTPLIISLHGLPEESYTRRLALALRVGGATITAYGPGTSASLHRIAVEHRVLHHGVPPPPPAMSRADFVRSVDVNPERRTVICVGRLVAQKNQQVLVRALEHLPADVVCVFVGEGADRGLLMDLSKQLGVDDRVRITGWREDARALLSAADVVAMPSRWEGFPLTALEALQAGAAFVASDAPGLREWIEDGVTALVVPTDDPLAIAAAVRRALGDQVLASRLRRNAREFGGKFTLERMLAEHMALYEDVLAQRDSSMTRQSSPVARPRRTS